MIQSSDKAGIFLNTRINPRRSHALVGFPALARRQLNPVCYANPRLNVATKSLLSRTYTPAVNTDTHSMPRPGTIPQALIHPCLLISLPAEVTRKGARSP